MSRLAATLLATCVSIAGAAELSVEQRLELLERRAARVTDLTLQLDEMRRENRELRGEIERLGYEIEQLKRQQRDIYLDIDQRLSGLDAAAPASASAPATAAPTGPSAPTASDRPTAPPVTDRAAIEAEYQAAYDLLSPQQKRYREAATAFTVFLDRYPNDPLAPNAQYWLGEAYYVSQENGPALAAFEKVIEDYPESNKAPGALFKIGRLHQAAGRRDAARTAYQRVLRDYPSSPAAGLARQQLQTLGG